LDVHKDNITACAIAAGGKVIWNRDGPSDEGWLREIHESMKGQEYCVMMESSTYSYAAYRFFQGIGIEAYVAHARSLEVITRSDKKTDKADAEKIGRLLRLWKRGELDDLSISYIPSPEQCELKDVCRYREELSRQMGDEVRRIRSHMARNCQQAPEGCANLSTSKSQRLIREAYPGDYTLLRRLDRYAALLKEKAAVTKEIVSRFPDSKEVDLLAGIPGIGRLTAVQIMSMVIDVGRFADAEKMCAYFGMVPRVRDSGGKERRGRMTKNGDRMMRSIMERVASSHIRCCESSVTEFYRRKEKEMGKKKALTAASRKMLALIFAVLRDMRPFTA